MIQCVKLLNLGGTLLSSSRLTNGMHDSDAGVLNNMVSERLDSANKRLRNLCELTCWVSNNELLDEQMDLLFFMLGNYT